MRLFNRTSKVNYLPDLNVELAVVGTSFRQAEFKGARGEQSFQLVADPTNQEDKNAVVVLLNRRQIGFLPADRAKPFSRLAQRLAKERTDVWVPGIIQEGESGLWVLLRVPAESTVSGWLKD